jgi:hypothetical protein
MHIQYVFDVRTYAHMREFTLARLYNFILYFFIFCEFKILFTYLLRKIIKKKINHIV